MLASNILSKLTLNSLYLKAHDTTIARMNIHEQPTTFMNSAWVLTHAQITIQLSSPFLYLAGTWLDYFLTNTQYTMS